MAGGSGTRFWPLSTPNEPKQFLDLTGEGTMLQLTVRRLKGLVSETDIWVVTNHAHRKLVLGQCPELSPERVVGEPVARNTAAAIALGAGLIRSVDKDAVMAVLPADHVIRDVTGFRIALKKAASLAQEGQFVTIGIKPTYAAEGYGYLEMGEPLAGPGCCRLHSFVEKPDRLSAERYLESGKYCWNAGMFAWRADALLSAMRTHLPAHAAMAEELSLSAGSPDWEARARKAFEPLEKISIDYGLMEKLPGISMVEASFDWSDVGGWLALEELFGRDAAGNTLKGRCVIKDCQGNIIVSQEGTGPVVASGMRDHVIVSGRAGTLVCPRSEVERIRPLVKEVLES